MKNIYIATTSVAAMLAAGMAFPACAQVNSAAPAAAQPAEDAAQSDIVVTARKRSESIQDVPLSVTALSAGLIETKNIVKIDQIAQVTPNTFMRSAGVIPTELNTYIRGIGDRSSEPSQDIPIAISIDGVYLSNTAGSLVDIFDIQQVEVLRGPQGTLQGRNSPAGAVNITTRRPTGEFALRTQVSFESYDSTQLKAFGEAPIIRNVLAAKVSAFFNHGGNFMYNQLTGHRDAGGVSDYGGRIGLLFTPTPNFKAYLSADYTHDYSPSGPIRPRPHAGVLPSPVAGGLPEPSPALCTKFGYCSEFPKYEYASNFYAPQHADIGGVALNADWNVGPVTITSVTGYRYVDQVTNLDDDGTPATVLNVLNRRVKVNSESQELRAASNGSGALSYVFGVYGLHSTFGYARSTQLGGPVVGLPATTILPATSLRDQTTNSYAVFGQGSYKITDKWSISGGARQSWDNKDLIATPSLTSGTGEFKANFSKLTVEAGTEYRFTRGNMLYFRFSQGYRAGGLNGQATSLLAINTYLPETVNSYELGLKTEWLERRLTANLTGFHYDYRNLQVGAVAFEPKINGVTTRLVNARGLVINGVEFETAYHPTGELSFNANISYLSGHYLSEILDFGAGPQQLRDLKKDSIPGFSGYFGFDYTIRTANNARFVLTSSVQYKGSESLNPLPTFIAIQPAYALVDGSITYHSPGGKFSVAIYGSNLTNQYYKINGDTATNIFEWDIVGRPRTIGIRITNDF